MVAVARHLERRPGGEDGVGSDLPRQRVGRVGDTSDETTFAVADPLPFCEPKPGFLLDGGTLTITRPTDVSV